VATGADQRALGVQVNMEGYWKGAAEKAKAEVEVTARAIRQMPAVKSLVERCGKAVGWQRLLYRPVFSVSACNTLVTPVTLRCLKGQTGVSGQNVTKIRNFIIKPLIWLQGCQNEIENTVP
jgi:hypothetical protein